LIIIDRQFVMLDEPAKIIWVYGRPLGVPGWNVSGS
jgi:hypothetical protein